MGNIITNTYSSEIKIYLIPNLFYFWFFPNIVLIRCYFKWVSSMHQKQWVPYPHIMLTLFSLAKDCDARFDNSAIECCLNMLNHSLEHSMSGCNISFIQQFLKKLILMYKTHLFYEIYSKLKMIIKRLIIRLTKFFHWIRAEHLGSFLQHNWTPYSSSSWVSS